MQTSPKILQRIAREVDRNPLWGMLIAREYFPASSNFFKALQTKAKQRLKEVAYPTEIESCLDKILKGIKPANFEEIREGIRLTINDGKSETKYQYEFSRTRSGIRYSTSACSTGSSGIHGQYKSIQKRITSNRRFDMTTYPSLT